jgi:hypothetical protein
LEVNFIVYTFVAMKEKKEIVPIRLAPSMRNAVMAIAKKDGTDFSKVSRELYDVYIEFYDYLSALAAARGKTTVGMMKIIINDYILKE